MDDDRTLAALLCGAALQSPRRRAGLEPLLDQMPGDLRRLAQAIIDNDPQAVWEALGTWKVTREGDAKTLARVAARLRAKLVRSQIKRIAWRIQHHTISGEQLSGLLVELERLKGLVE